MAEKEVQKKTNNNGFVKWFSELSSKDVAIAGNKGVILAEMYNNNFPVPPGFVITSNAYKYFIEKNSLNKTISEILNSIDIKDKNALEKNAKKIREMIINANIQDEMREEILESYEVLDVDKKKFVSASSRALDILKASHEQPFVAVRSSATILDNGKTLLNVKGNENLIENIKKCFASLFTEEAIYEREKKEIQHDESEMAVVVQCMVDSGKSGVIFSKNPSKDDGNIIIKAVFGLGHGIISERISPDYYVINPKEDFKIIERKVSDKKFALARNSSGKIGAIELDDDLRKKNVLSGYQIKMLAQLAAEIDEHFGEPQDIQFAIKENEIYIINSRPIEIKYEEDEEIKEETEKKPEEKEAEVSKTEKEEKKTAPIVTAPSIPEMQPGQLEDINEEELILKALEEDEQSGDVPILFSMSEIESFFKKDEYLPGLEKKDDVPPLNEAIPVSSEDFQDEEEEEILEIKKDEIDEEPEANPESGGQPDEIDEVDEMLGDAEVNGDSHEKEEDEVLDVF